MTCINIKDGTAFQEAAAAEQNAGRQISDRNITAVFNRATCNVNVSVSPQDTGKYEGAGTYNKGGNVELTAQAYDGYEGSYYSTQNVIYLALPASLTSDTFKEGFAAGSCGEA